MKYYECHITMLGDPAKIKPLVESYKWKFSAIDGDSVFGDGVKCYATMMYSALNDQQYCVNKTLDVANNLELLFHVKVIRRKVELVVFDDRSKDVKCDGGCCEL